MRLAARSNHVRTAAVLSAGAVMIGGLPLASATSAHGAPDAVSADAKASTKQTGAQKKRAQRQRQRERADRARSSLVRVGLNQRGKQYVYGANGPRVFDCSGFTQYVYRQATGRYLPHHSSAQMHRARRVGLGSLKPGDLMFYGPGGSQHVAMYIGKGKMIHATNPRSDVRIDSIHNGYWRGRFAGAGRIVEG
jgi:cell wall-associated NlpC family hydrolase